MATIPDWNNSEEEMKRFARINGIEYTVRRGSFQGDDETFLIGGFDYPEHWPEYQRCTMAEKIGRRFFPESFEEWKKEILFEIRDLGSALPEDVLARYEEAINV